VCAGAFKAEIVQHFLQLRRIVAVVTGELDAFVAHLRYGFQCARQVALTLFAHGIQL
jgi:hypothetical protein